MTFTLAEVDLALTHSAELSVDDLALLWLARAELIGQPLQPASLMYLMGVSEDEAEDIFARLAEHGVIDAPVPEEQP